MRAQLEQWEDQAGALNPRKADEAINCRALCAGHWSMNRVTPQGPGRVAPTNRLRCLKGRTPTRHTTLKHSHAAHPERHVREEATVREAVLAMMPAMVPEGLRLIVLATDLERDSQTTRATTSATSKVFAPARPEATAWAMESCAWCDWGIIS